VENALEQKLTSRIEDRRRALSGRSPIESALAGAVQVDAPAAEGGRELVDPTAEVVSRVANADELRRIWEVMADLSEDQKLVLSAQSHLDLDCAAFCDRYGWTAEKYRKVAQRARAKLRVLVGEYEVGERCQQFEREIIAYTSGVSSDAQRERVELHLANCPGCARRARALRLAGRRVAALLPVPAGLGAAGVGGRVGGLGLWLRRAIGWGARGDAAGGSVAGAGAVKLGAVAAVCLAGAGGYAVCAGVPVFPAHHSTVRRARLTIVHHIAQAAVAVPERSVTVSDPTHVSTTALTASSPRRSSRKHIVLTGRAAVVQAGREFGATSAHSAAVIQAQPAAPPPSPAAGRAAAQAQQEFGPEGG
jgi:hypothetical protein